MTKYYSNSKYNAAFDRCIDVMSKLVLKYGNKVLEKSDIKTDKLKDKKINK